MKVQYDPKFVKEVKENFPDLYCLYQHLDSGEENDYVGLLLRDFHNFHLTPNMILKLIDTGKTEKVRQECLQYMRQEKLITEWKRAYSGKFF